MMIPTEVLGGGILLLLVILLSASHVVRYCVKFTVFILLSTVAATAFIPLMLLKPCDYRNALLPAWGARQISKLLGLKWKVRGLENVVKDSGCVVIINHQSALDLLVLAEIWPLMERCTVIAKREVFFFWPFGLACWLWGTIFIDRLNVEKAITTVNKTGETIRSKKARVCMFPEGTRNSETEMLPFKKGAFHIAIASQTYVQPVVVSRYYFLDAKRHIFNTGENVISILPAISTKNMQRDDIESLMQKARNSMTTEIAKISEEVTQRKSEIHVNSSPKSD